MHGAVFLGLCKTACNVDAPIIKSNKESLFPWLSGLHRGTFFAVARSQEPLEEAVTYCLQKQAHVQKVVSSSPKTSWENAVSMRHERGLTHPFADDTERHVSNFYVELLPQVRVLGINVLFFVGLNKS